MKEKNSMVEENGFKYGWGKEVDVEINSPNLFPHLYLSKLRHQEGRTREARVSTPVAISHSYPFPFTQ